MQSRSLLVGIFFYRSNLFVTLNRSQYFCRTPNKGIEMSPTANIYQSICSEGARLP